MIAGPDFRIAAPPRPNAPPKPPRPDPAPEAEQWLGDEGDEDRSRWMGVITISVLLHVLVIGIIGLGWYLYQAPEHSRGPSLLAELQDGRSAAADHTQAKPAPAIDRDAPAADHESDRSADAPPAAVSAPAPAPAPAVAPAPAPPVAQAPPPAPAELASTAAPPPPPRHTQPALRRVKHTSPSTATERSEFHDALLPKSRDPLLAWPPRPPVLAPPSQATAEGWSRESPPESRDPLLGSELDEADTPESRDPLLAHTR